MHPSWYTKSVCYYIQNKTCDILFWPMMAVVIVFKIAVENIKKNSYNSATKRHRFLICVSVIGFRGAWNSNKAISVMDI